VYIFSAGVIFALKVLTSRETPPGREWVQFIWVPTRYAAWAELILIHLLVPNASFMGHLAGILSGLIYTSTPIGKIVDKLISSLTGLYTLLINTGWGIKISDFSKGHCEGCSGGREVGVVSCGWLASTVVSTHNGLDR